jgi:Leucine-rich repeat (LRR) protein
MNNTIYHLVPDIFSHIFNLLPITDIKSLSITSKFFNELCKSKHIWKNSITIMNFIMKIKNKPQNITISQLCNTKILDLSNRYGDAIPANGKYNSPTHLGQMYKPQLNIPTELGQLANLEELYLSGNNLKTMPVELCNLHNLKILCLHQNSLSTIPTEIGNMHKLTKLYLGNNQLRTIPTELAYLTNLKTITLFCNYKTVSSMVHDIIGNNVKLII